MVSNTRPEAADLLSEGLCHTVNNLSLSHLFTVLFLHCRIFWTLLLLGLFIVFLYYLALRVKQYLKFEKNVSVEENYVPFISFPAVTLCNQNFYR